MTFSISLLIANSCTGPFDIESELCIGHTTTSKPLAMPAVQQRELFDHNDSPVTECVVPVDKEQFKCML